MIRQALILGLLVSVTSACSSDTRHARSFRARGVATPANGDATPTGSSGESASPATTKSEGTPGDAGDQASNGTIRLTLPAPAMALAGDVRYHLTLSSPALPKPAEYGPYEPGATINLDKLPPAVYEIALRKTDAAGAVIAEGRSVVDIKAGQVTQATIVLGTQEVKPDTGGVVIVVKDKPADGTSEDKPQSDSVVCLGGPACNISFVVKDMAEAQLCMKTANGSACANDPLCGNQFLLQVCACKCAAQLPPLDAGKDCRRYNPLKPGAKALVSGCHKA